MALPASPPVKARVEAGNGYPLLKAVTPATCAYRLLAGNL